LPELQLGIIAAGLQEQGRRETKQLWTLTAAATAESDRIAQQSLFIAKVALSIAAVTLVASLVISLVT
jgi:hypothetical protein